MCPAPDSMQALTCRCSTCYRRSPCPSRHSQGTPAPAAPCPPPTDLDRTLLLPAGPSPCTCGVHTQDINFTVQNNPRNATQRLGRYRMTGEYVMSANLPLRAISHQALSEIHSMQQRLELCAQSALAAAQHMIVLVLTVFHGLLSCRLV